MTGPGPFPMSEVDMVAADEFVEACVGVSRARDALAGRETPETREAMANAMFGAMVAAASIIERFQRHVRLLRGTDKAPSGLPS